MGNFPPVFWVPEVLNLMLWEPQDGRGVFNSINYHCLITILMTRAVNGDLMAIFLLLKAPPHLEPPVCFHTSWTPGYTYQIIWRSTGHMLRFYSGDEYMDTLDIAGMMKTSE